MREKYELFIHISGWVFKAAVQHTGEAGTVKSIPHSSVEGGRHVSSFHFYLCRLWQEVLPLKHV